MTVAEGPHVLRVPAARALEERDARRALSPSDYERLCSLIPDMGLEGAPFDELSRVYPLEVPANPRVVVLSETPRRVSVGLLNDRGQFVGVVGDNSFEEACTAHPGAMFYIVGNISERVKENRVYLNLRPRGWVRVELEPECPVPEPRRKSSRKH